MRIKIAQVGEAVLRQDAQALTRDQIHSPQIRDLIEHMRETLADAPGVGLAAPQIAERLQLLVVEDKAEYQATLTEVELKERERKPISFHVLINPTLRFLSEPDTTFFEGCLSLPGFLGMVPRARRVLVEALDHRGEAVRIDAHGWYARILQHEIDHLRGTLYIDRMWSRSFCSQENYVRHLKPIATTELLERFRPGGGGGTLLTIDFRFEPGRRDSRSH
jgi:peptide deformylase